MGEEKKEEASKDEEEEKDDEQVKQEEKKEAEEAPPPPPEIVLKVDMHCEACARKVARALKGFEGVEEVRADYKASKVVVKAGKNSGAAADPVKVCQRIQKKTGRKVELISPLPKPPTDLETQQQESQQKQPQDQQPKPEEDKQEPPAVVTVVLKVQMHCEACAQVLQKRIGKFKGVESVATDIANNQVIVKGVVDPEKLVNDVYKRTHKHASIVKKEDKKEEEKKDEKQEDKKQAEEGKEEDAKIDIKKIEHWPQKYYMEYAYAPQIFSDENPNACSLM